MFVQHWHTRTEYKVSWFIKQLGIRRSKFYDWVNREGEANQYGGQQPKHHWLTEKEKEAIITYYKQHRQMGYRRLTYMMLDENVVATSPSSVYRVLTTANLLQECIKEPSRKGQGFSQPKEPHQHWHIDITYINICGTFYYLCTILDGFSRYIVHWEIRAAMRETDIEVILQRAREAFPQARPRIISDNGPQFISRDFKHFVRLCGMQHVRTSPYYPQSNGKIERWHQTLKQECIRPGTPLCVEDGQRLVRGFVQQYNCHRLHSAIGYITPEAKLNRREEEITAERQKKLVKAREQRKLFWQGVEPALCS